MKTKYAYTCCILAFLISPILAPQFRWTWQIEMSPYIALPKTIPTAVATQLDLPLETEGKALTLLGVAKHKFL